MHKSSAASVGGGKGRVAAESSKKPDVAIAPAITDQMSSNAVRRVVMGDFHDAQREVDRRLAAESGEAAGRRKASALNDLLDFIAAHRLAQAN